MQRVIPVVIFLLSLAHTARAQPLSDDVGAAIDERIAQENKAKDSRFAMLSHKPNYLLPVSYTSSPNSPAYAAFPDIRHNLSNVEFKFQLSFKFPLWTDILGGRASVYVAYSQLALWQAYNAKISAPFRETNYEPEAFMVYRTDFNMLGGRLKFLSLGFNHQSNGQTDPLSRSWNRVIGGAVLEKGKNYVFLRQWVRMPERAKSDNNPRMEKYFGYGELQVGRNGKLNSFSLMLRNNLRSRGNKGAVQMDWTFPLYKKFRGYVQVFNGYGETLISYDRQSTRVGLGIALTEWL